MQLVLAMLGMGATLTGRDFRDVVAEPLAVTVGTLVQLVAVPVTAFLFLLAQGIQLFGGAITLEGLTAIKQLLYVFFINRTTLTLTIRAVIATHIRTFIPLYP